MRIILLVILALHGLIHIMGFVKSVNPALIEQLHMPVPKVARIFWLLAAILFLVSAVLYFLKTECWWVPATVAIAVSQVLIVLSWHDARFGTIANLIILLPVIMGIMSSLPSSYGNVYKAEVKKRLHPGIDTTILTDTDIQVLPDIVQKYLRYTGAVGKPKVHNVRIVFNGSMKRNMESGWMNITSHQYNFFDQPARFFYIEAAVFGMPFDGLHLYRGSNATMQIKVASLFQVVDAKGEKMSHGETVTIFNDMCLMAPATLIDPRIHWEPVDPLTVKARFTNEPISITALLKFNEKGELVDFISNDRYYSENGKTYLDYQWSTPVRNYVEFNGRKVPSYGEAVWQTPGGKCTYARFDLKEIEYNCSEFK